jgi:hypothetical protein
MIDLQIFLASIGKMMEENPDVWSDWTPGNISSSLKTDLHTCKLFSIVM